MNLAKNVLIQNGLHYSKWGKVISAASDVGKFNREDQIAVNNYCHCPTAESIPPISYLTDSKIPVDEGLLELNASFKDAVQSNLPIAAAYILSMIQKRATEVYNG